MIGKKIYNFAKELWPINRSLSGEGVRETLKTIARPKGYKNYTEQNKPVTDDIEQADLDNIRSNLMRIEKDNIVDTVLPSLA